jgi:hypothetical protein
VNLRAAGWGLVYLAAGIAIAIGWIGGNWGIGPRAGAASLLIVLALVLLVGSFAAAIRARTDRLDGKGVCPVGATCSCGHFNFKPRRACRQCGAATVYPA